MAAGNWVSLRDLAMSTGLAKTTAFNLVSALVDVGLAERDAKAGAYRLSLQHLSYGKAVERRLDIATVARPHLIRLCALTRETVNLALPCPTDSLIVESLEGSQTLRVSSYAGTRASYHSTACGARSSPIIRLRFRQTIYSLGNLPASTDRTITDPEILEAVLAECREVGWTSEFEENEMGGVCVAAPIFDPHGDVVAAVSIAGPAARFTKETIARGWASCLSAIWPKSPLRSRRSHPLAFGFRLPSHGQSHDRRRILLAGIFPLNPPGDQNDRISDGCGHAALPSSIQSRDAGGRSRLRLGAGLCRCRPADRSPTRSRARCAGPWKTEKVLKSAGSDLAHVVQTRNYVRDGADLADFNRIYPDFFKEPYPARTTITNCLSASLRYEIECIAVVRAGD